MKTTPRFRWRGSASATYFGVWLTLWVSGLLHCGMASLTMDLPSILVNAWDLLPHHDAYAQAITGRREPATPIGWEFVLPTSAAYAGLLFCIHAASLWACDALARHLGWPGHWAEMRRDSSLASRIWRQAWTKSSLHFLLTVPAVQLAWAWFTQMGEKAWSNDVALDVGTLSLALNWLTIVAVDLIVTGRTFFRTVKRAIPPDELRCVECGQHLGKPPTARCPECGTPVMASNARMFTLTRLTRRSSAWKPRAVWLIPIIMVLAPLVLPQARALMWLVSRK